METDIPYSYDTVKNNLDAIQDASNIIYEREIIDRVQKEAQNQADIREAE